MAGIDAEGFDVLKSSTKVRLTFDTPIRNIRNIEDARQALAAIAKCKTSPLTLSPQTPILHRFKRSRYEDLCGTTLGFYKTFEGR